MIFPCWRCHQASRKAIRGRQVLISGAIPLAGIAPISAARTVLSPHRYGYAHVTQGCGQAVGKGHAHAWASSNKLDRHTPRLTAKSFSPNQTVRSEHPNRDAEIYLMAASRALSTFWRYLDRWTFGGGVTPVNKLRLPLHPQDATPHVQQAPPVNIPHG